MEFGPMGRISKNGCFVDGWDLGASLMWQFQQDPRSHWAGAITPYKGQTGDRSTAARASCWEEVI